MMIYANGQGVPRNIPLAKRFVCKYTGTGEDISRKSRLAHLDNLNTNDDSTFHVCDDGGNPNFFGACAHLRHDSEVRAIEKRANETTNGWDKQSKGLFDLLWAAHAEFASYRSAEEVDLSGSSRAYFVAQESSIQYRDFLESLEKLISGKALRYSKEQHLNETKMMNYMYGKLLINPEEISPNTTVTSTGVKKAQEAWIKYRKVWVDLAAKQLPNYSEQSVAAWFTKKRNHMLRSLL